MLAVAVNHPIPDDVPTRAVFNKSAVKNPEQRSITPVVAWLATFDPPTPPSMSCHYSRYFSPGPLPSSRIFPRRSHTRTYMSKPHY
jgi:hypothetical protein